MKKHLFTTLLLSTLTLPVCAEGIYVFADFERNKVEHDVYDFSISQSNNGYGLGLGYTLTNHFALEVAYRDELFSFDVVEISEDYEYRETTELSAIQASLVASYPLSGSVSVYGRLGVGRITADSHVYASTWFDSTGESDSNTETKALFGIGGRYAISEQVGIRAEYSRFAEIEDTTISSLSLAVDYHF
jgi:OmpA-OmpF porin, OOP family